MYIEFHAKFHCESKFCKAKKSVTICTHPVHQLPHHAVPDLRLWISGSVFSVRHDGDLVLDPNVLGDLGGQVHAVALVLVVALVQLPVLLQHHVGALLQGAAQGGERQDCLEERRRQGLMAAAVEQAVLEVMSSGVDVNLINDSDQTTSEAVSGSLLTFIEG